MIPIYNTVDYWGRHTEEASGGGLTGYDFEEFDKTARPAEGALTITWQKRGQVGLSQAAYKALDEPEAVKLYFDRGQRVMGIKASDLQTPNAVRVKQQPRSSSHMFTGAAFATRYNIPLGDQARRYQAEMHGDILTVDLKQQPMDASRGAPKKRDEFGRIAPS